MAYHTKYTFKHAHVVGVVKSFLSARVRNEQLEDFFFMHKHINRMYDPYVVVSREVLLGNQSSEPPPQLKEVLFLLLLPYLGFLDRNILSFIIN